MKKQHSNPEFTIIRNNEENRKFFTASGPTPEPSSTGGTLGSMTINDTPEPW